MRVYGFKAGEKGSILEIENTLKAEQQFVGGYIEVLGLTEELDLVCNEEGKLEGLEPSVAWIGEGENIEKKEILEIICGNCFICRHTEDGDFDSIKESDIAVINDMLKEIILTSNQKIIISL